MNALIDAYKLKFGTAPPAITASLERTNLLVFEQKYAQAIDQGLTPAQAAQSAINATPAGKARIEAGYGNFEVIATDFKLVNLGVTQDGVDLGFQLVPTKVIVVARPTMGGK